MSLFDPAEQKLLHTGSAHAARATWSRKIYPSVASPALQPVIPAAAIFDGLADDASVGVQPASSRQITEGTDIPSEAECAVHLELLEAFMVLKQAVVNSSVLDTYFGIARQGKKDAGLAGKRESKWACFVGMAVGRFERWWDRVAERVELVELLLPPLDVLLVWHAYKLNPQAYAKDCQQYKKPPFWHTAFPWKTLHDHIDPSTRYYKPPSSSATFFTTITSQPFDLLANLKTLPPLSTPLRSLPTHETQAIRNFCIELGYPPSPRFIPSIDLLAATLRQSRFMTRMCHLLWIRSPSLSATLARARTRYAQFFQLLAQHPDKTMVPTVDIDLVWHTHQLSAAAYAAFSRRVAGGRVVDHKDSIGNGVRGEALTVVRGLWRVEFGEEYARCFCWDCEHLLTVVGWVEGGGRVDREVVKKVAEGVREDVDYYRAVEKARRKGDMLPIRK